MFSFTVDKPVCVKDSSGEGTCLFQKKHNGNMDSSSICPLHNVNFGKQSLTKSLVNTQIYWKIFE